MKLINGSLKLSSSTEKELKKLNEIFVEESRFFLKIEGETGPSPEVCFRKGVLRKIKVKKI